MEKLLLSIAEAAGALNVSRDTIRRMLARRLIRPVRVLRRVTGRKSETSRSAADWQSSCTS